MFTLVSWRSHTAAPEDLSVFCLKVLSVILWSVMAGDKLLHTAGTQKANFRRFNSAKN